MHKLLEPLIAGRSEQWTQAMSQDPNPLAGCMEIVGSAYGELVDDYPTEPNKPPRRVRGEISRERASELTSPETGTRTNVRPRTVAACPDRHGGGALDVKCDVGTPRAAPGSLAGRVRLTHTAFCPFMPC